MCPDDDAYPVARLSEKLPLPVLLWVLGEVALLKASGVAIAGSRSAPDGVLGLASELAALIARAGWNVVSGAAAGVDRAAHASARQLGTTTAVLAEGVDRVKSAPWGGDGHESALIVSGFDPGAAWTASRAMERNAHIAALADAVVIVAAGLSGGSWAQGQLCLRARKRLLVFDLSPDIAPGNARLIAQGATPISPDRLDHVLDQVTAGDVAPAQLDMLG